MDDLGLKELSEMLRCVCNRQLALGKINTRDWSDSDKKRLEFNILKNGKLMIEINQIFNEEKRIKNIKDSVTSENIYDLLKNSNGDLKENDEIDFNLCQALFVLSDKLESAFKSIDRLWDEKVDRE
jgi:hypothetical protein